MPEEENKEEVQPAAEEVAPEEVPPTLGINVNEETAAEDKVL